MLHELFTYATARCPSYVRRMGYLYEAIALQGRHARQKAVWQSHLEKSRQFVLSSAGKCRSRGKVIIIGSGLLLDVPLAELAAMFREVELLDVVFLPKVHKAVRAHGNLRMIERDVTGASENLYESIRSGRPALPGAQCEIPCDLRGCDLVVSLNIMSQLAVIPERYVMAHAPAIAAKVLEAWCREITGSHYRALCSLACDVCLVTDYEYAKRDPQGRIIETGDTLRGLSLPRPEETWTWDLAPVGEFSRKFSKELRVGAWHMR